MGKWIVIGFFVILGLIWFSMAPITSSYLSKKMGVPVTIGQILVWPKKTQIAQFRISNPEGYRSHTAFAADYVGIEYQWSSLMSDPVTIDSILLDDVVLNIQLDRLTADGNNWSVIASRVAAPKGNVLIRTLKIKDLTVVVQGAAARSLNIAGTRHFDELTFHDINSANGFPTKELIHKIFDDIGLKQYLQNLLDPIQQLKKTFKLFGVERDAEASSPSSDTHL